MDVNVSSLPLDRLPPGLHRLSSRDGAVVVKRRSDAPPDFFAAEAAGLEALRAAAAVRVPRVLRVEPASLVLEDLGTGVPSAAFWKQAGAGLARLHGIQGERFGFERDGYCGPSPQANPPMHDGWRFFAECRLLPQAHRAHRAGAIDTADMRATERLCARLPEWVPPQPPVLLHGDLWLGNLHCCGDGTPALIDAGAVHCGWAETELAMLSLFGEPPPAFWRAYTQQCEPATDWRERAPLYNLYHLLNHLNLFGTAYLGQVRAVLARFG